MSQPGRPVPAGPGSTATLSTPVRTSSLRTKPDSVKYRSRPADITPHGWSTATSGQAAGPPKPPATVLITQCRAPPAQAEPGPAATAATTAVMTAATRRAVDREHAGIAVRATAAPARSHAPANVTTGDHCGPERFQICGKSLTPGAPRSAYVACCEFRSSFDGRRDVRQGHRHVTCVLRAARIPGAFIRSRRHVGVVLAASRDQPGAARLDNAVAWDPGAAAAVLLLLR